MKPRPHWPIIAVAGSLILFVVGASGYAVFSYAEAARALQAKLRWAKQQEKLLSAGLENLSSERKALEQAQLELSTQLADQRGEIKTLREERDALLVGIRQVTQHNRELSRGEEEVAAALSRGEGLESDLESAAARLRDLDRTNRRLDQKIAEYQRKLSDAETLSGRLRAETESRVRKELEAGTRQLQARYDARITALQNKIQALETQTKTAGRQADEAPLLAAGEMVLRRKLQSLRRERNLETAVYYYNMGNLYAQIRNFRQAARMYEKALTVNPNDPHAHRNLGLLYHWNLNNRKKALYHYQRFLELSPDEKERGQVQRWIAEAEREIGQRPESIFEVIKRLFSALR